MEVMREKITPDVQHIRGQNLETPIPANIDPATIDQALVFQENHNPGKVEEEVKPPPPPAKA